MRDLTCMQQASYLEGGPLLWILPLYLHVNKKSSDDDDGDDSTFNVKCKITYYFVQFHLVSDQCCRRERQTVIL